MYDDVTVYAYTSATSGSLAPDHKSTVLLIPWVMERLVNIFLELVSTLKLGNDFMWKAMVSLYPDTWARTRERRKLPILSEIVWRSGDPCSERVGTTDLGGHFLETKSHRHNALWGQFSWDKISSLLHFSIIFMAVLIAVLSWTSINIDSNKYDSWTAINMIS